MLIVQRLKYSAYEYTLKLLMRQASADRKIYMIRIFLQISSLPGCFASILNAIKTEINFGIMI